MKRFVNSASTVATMQLNSSTLSASMAAASKSSISYSFRFFFSSRRRHTRLTCDWSSDVCSSDLMNTTMQKIPGIGDIPILGLLFKSKAAQKNQTELVVMITPEILANNSPGVTPNLPKLVEPYLPPLSMKKEVPIPAPAFKTSDAQPAAPPVAVAKPSPADKAPAAAAATAKANAPAARAAKTPAAPAKAAAT